MRVPPIGCVRDEFSLARRTIRYAHDQKMPPIPNDARLMLLLFSYGSISVLLNANVFKIKINKKQQKIKRFR